MQVTVVKQQEFHVPAGLDWIGSEHTHVLAWQEDATTIDYWTELFDPECAAAVKREWQQGKLTIHTGFSHEQQGVEIWEGMDKLIAFSSRQCNTQKPQRHYVNMNFTSRWHRRRMLTELRKVNMIDRGLISWGGDKQPLKDHWFPDVWRQTEPPEQYVHTNDEQDMPSPPVDIWSQTAFNLISEAHHNDVGHQFSEKTWQAIWLQRPFLINGAPGIHAELQRQGYALMPWVDYAFDTEPDAARRIKMLAEQVAKLCTDLTPGQIARQTRKLTAHNLSTLKNSVLGDTPPAVIDLPTVSTGARGIIDYIHRVRTAVAEL